MISYRSAVRTAAFTLLGFWVLLPRGASAGVTVTIQPTGPGAQFAQQAGISVDALANQLRTNLDDLLQLANQDSYLQHFADAQGFTTKGLGVDYASNLRYFEVGIAGNASVNVNNSYLPSNIKNQAPLQGAGLNATIMAGLNLKFLDLPQVTLFGNYFQGSYTDNQHAGHLDNWGAHVHMRFFRPAETPGKADHPVYWGGFGITSGVDYSKTTLSLASGTLTEDIALDSPTLPGAKVVWSGQGRFDVGLRTWSIPIELTTSLRLLYFLTLYGGAGFDLQPGGGGDMTLNLAGKIVGVPPGGAASSEIGTVTVTDQASAGPGRSHLRALGGVQVNLFFIRLFTQLNVQADGGLVGVAFGGRFAY